MNITNTNELLWAKVRPGAIIPTKEEENGGYDIYANFEEDCFAIAPLETRLVPTGIASAFDKKYVGIIEERGSTGSKGIKKSAGVIDSGYRGEWFVPITNTTNKCLVISKKSEKEFYSENGIANVEPHECLYYPYTKGIAQVVFQEVPVFKEKEVTIEELRSIPSKRQNGSLGSSGK